MLAKDLVCGMDVETETAEWKSDYQGTTYYFCSPGCKRTFEKDPEKYVKGDQAPDAGHMDHH
jgi:Cu+-exporting ATPase